VRAAPGAAFRSIALALPAAEEVEHMGSPAFRVSGKIFAQLAELETAGLVKLSLAEQDACLATDPERFWVPAHWSKFGWTYVRLTRADPAELSRLLEMSWRLIAPKRLAATLPAAKRG
jgi:hypothetical protein